jgi:hypothetical protein
MAENNGYRDHLPEELTPDEIRAVGGDFGPIKEEAAPAPKRAKAAPAAKAAPKAPKKAATASSAGDDADIAFIKADIIKTGLDNRYIETQQRLSSLTTESPMLASMVAITNAIPGEVFGNLARFNVSVQNGHLTEQQEASFAKGGVALVQEMTRNLRLQQAIGRKIDLNGDGVVEPDERAAYAGALDQKHTVQVASGMSTEDSLRKLAKEAGSDSVVARAQKIFAAMGEAPSSDAPPAAALAQAQRPAGRDSHGR